jgi:hypothetical protein
MATLFVIIADRHRKLAVATFICIEAHAIFRQPSRLALFQPTVTFYFGRKTHRTSVAMDYAEGKTRGAWRVTT